MNRRSSIAIGLSLCGMLLPGGAPRAAPGDVLAECTALSPVEDDIHACLDNYLDTLDGKLRDVGAQVRRRFDDPGDAAFDRAQEAFDDYRRENCLWYLSFSTPRAEAELIAKNCLARTSLGRLTELQGLLTTADSSRQRIDGFYVYGAERNTFTPCGSEARYWVEGDRAAVGTLQQDYLAEASTSLQIMFASVTGELDDSLQASPGHRGVLKLASVEAVRVPSESDCRVPNGAPAVQKILANEGGPSPTDAAGTDTDTAQADSTGAGGTANPNPVADPTPDAAANDDGSGAAEGEERLTAYFGAWLVDCTTLDEARRCKLEVALRDPPGTLPSATGGSSLVIERDRDGIESMALRFSGREIDSPSRIRWAIDADILGDIVGSAIRVDAEATRQIVDDRPYLNGELLPLMKEGSDLVIDVVADGDDVSGERYVATLMGLTRALEFAYGYAREIQDF